MTGETQEASMGRRVAALAVVVCALWWSSGALAQTTTSTTTIPTTSTSTTTTVTLPPATTTTIPNPCAGQVCTEQPPDAFLAGSAGEVRLDVAGYCWRGTRASLCADRFSGPDIVLRVTAGETLTLRFASMTPSSVTLRHQDNREVSLPATNPTRMVVQLPVGSHDVAFFTRWSQGDATYIVRLDVRAGRSLTLTG